MTTYTKTISNGLNVTGPGPTEKFGELVYGSDVWLGGDDTALMVLKRLFQAIAVDDLFMMRLLKGVANTVDVDAIVTRVISKMITDGISISQNNVVMPIKWIFENPTVSSTVTNQVSKSIENAATVTSNLTVELLRGIWRVVFAGGTTDAASRHFPTWVNTALITTSWTETSGVSTTWTET